MTRIAIVGMGGVFPDAPDPDALWELVLSGRSAARTPPAGRWTIPPAEAHRPGPPQPDAVYTANACLLREPPADFAGLDLDPAWLDGTDPLLRVALHCAAAAWRDAKMERVDRRRVGAILGAIALPTERSSAQTRALFGPLFAARLGMPWPEPTATHPWDGLACGLPAALVCRALGLGGRWQTLDAACASSLYALKLAADELRAGRADAMLAGGISRPDSLYTQMGFAQLGALSKGGVCRPLDARADGLLVGEGGGVFVLKRLADALAAGDRIHATIAGCGLSNDLEGNLLAPSSEGQLRALRQAYAEAGWALESVGLIECHATGTPMGDAVELASLAELWRDRPARRGKCVLGSVKANVGHLLTGAGAASVCKLLLALKHGVLPPTANWSMPPRGGAEPFRMLHTAEDWPAVRQPRRAAATGFGFGGINAHLLLEEWIAGPEQPRAAVAVPELPARTELAIVGVGILAGPWQGREAFARRALLGELDHPPQPPTRWRGLPEAPLGHYLEQLSMPVGRFPIPPNEFAALMPQQALMLLAADEAWRDAGGDGLAAEQRRRAGLCVGLGLDPSASDFHFRWSLRALTHGQPEFLPRLRDAAGPALDPERVLGHLGGITASRVARALRLGGPSFAVAAEDASGLAALHTAGRLLAAGEIDLALVGAVDAAGDPRRALFTRPEGTLPCDAAAAFVLKRRADAEAAGDRVYALLDLDKTFPPPASGGGLGWGAGERRTNVAGDSLPPRFLDTLDLGAAEGMVRALAAALELHHATRGGSAWLRNRAEGPRRTTVQVQGMASADAALSEHPAGRRRAKPRPTNLPADYAVAMMEAGPPTPLPPCEGEIVLAFEADTVDGVAAKLAEAAAAVRAGADVHEVARRQTRWPGAKLGLAVVCDAGNFEAALGEANAHLANRGLALPARHAFFNPRPLGGDVAFVFPGSGNQYAGMATGLLRRFPALAQRFDAANQRLADQCRHGLPNAAGASALDVILAQVSAGAFAAAALGECGVRPAAALGYSLGESALMFALGVWRDRDGMLARLEASPLFQTDLAGRCDAARAAWGLPADEPMAWRTVAVQRSAGETRAALADEPRLHLLAINGPAECVLGGDAHAVARALRRLGTPGLEVRGASTVHCEVARQVADAYRELHRLPVAPPRGVRVYAAALGRAYEPTADAVAEALSELAFGTLDFPRVVEAAYADGARVFVECGPGASCSRMIGEILGPRPHRTAACLVAGSEHGAFLRTLAALLAERCAVDAAPALPTSRERARPVTSRSVTVRFGGEPFDPPALPLVHPHEDPVEEPVPVALPMAPMLARPPARREAGVMVAPTVNGVADWRAEATMFEQFERGQAALAAAHAAFLRLTTETYEGIAALAGASGTINVAALADVAACPPPQPSPRSVGREWAPALRLDVPRSLSREECLRFAVGGIGDVLGERFAEIDAFPTRVRLPDEPLMLVDRILAIDGEPLTLGEGRVVTEHDVHPGAWYLDGGRIPTCIAVEAGQADLFLAGFLGIDLRTRGLAVYRLLDANVTFHGPLPGAGQTIHYDIRIKRFFEQSGAWLFHFEFDGTVAGRPTITMRDGCAGFFTAAALAAGRGVVRTALELQPRAGKRPADWRGLAPMAATSLDERALAALRAGDLPAAFGPAFAGLPVRRPMTLPGGTMRLVHRVPTLDPTGGRFGLGLVRGEADIRPDDWFLTCHFVDDQVMPGTLMYECCLHTLRVFLLRLGWVAEEGRVAYEPVPGVPGRLKCRGQVLPTTKVVTYEIEVKELGYGPEPYAIADALMYADGKPIVEIGDMSVRLAGQTRESVEGVWRRALPAEAGPPPQPSPRSGKREPERRILYDPESIRAFAVGKPSVAFGDQYRVFDKQRVIARLPGPPYQFLDRIVHIDNCQPWKLSAGAEIVAEYDVPPGEWYFPANAGSGMPFAVLLEVALQPCGWLAAYLGSALTSATDMSFRNLGGRGTLHRPVGPDLGTLATKVTMTKVANSGGMLIQHYDFAVSAGGEPVYTGDTYFGFFTKSALANQVGIRDAKLYNMPPDEARRVRRFAYPQAAPFPVRPLRMVDDAETVAAGGPQGLGFARGVKRVDPTEWFFAAHFHQDPVCPGSLGLESFLQLAMLLAAERWPGTARFQSPGLGNEHRWTYRGQVLPTDGEVRIEAAATAVDDRTRTLTADGWLSVDGRNIYRMEHFAVRAETA